MVTCVGMSILASTVTASAQNFTTDEFLYGACVYPEIMERDDWQQMLVHMKAADMNVVRVAESAWGVINPAPGEYHFEWLDTFLSDAESRGIKSILGTSSYVPPIWLVHQHPDIVTIRDGHPNYPLIKKSPEITHPIYRQQAIAYIEKIANRYRSNSNVIGWQLDNEIDITLKSYVENQSAQERWFAWLVKHFTSPDDLNEKFQLDIFGLRINDYEQIPLIRSEYEDWSPVGIRLNYWKFRRDMIFDFFDQQRVALDLENSGQWITTNWTGPWKALTNDPRAGQVLDISGIDFYHPSDTKPGHWKHLGYQLDLNRLIHPDNGFLVMEVGLGVTGNTSMNQFIDWAGGAMIQQNRFFMQNIFPAAFGASGLLYWTGNRIHGSHAPYYGGVVGWDSEPTLEYPWVQEIGQFYKRWGAKLIAEPVQSSVAIFTDYDQRAALEVVSHVENSQNITVEAFDLFHKMGLGVDALNGQQMTEVATLGQYSAVVLATSSVMMDAQVIDALRTYVANGGTLIVTPLTDYLTEHAIFQNELGARIKELTGTRIRTTRMFGGPTADDYDLPTVDVSQENLPPPILQADGLAEFLVAEDSLEILATFRSELTILAGYPAITQNQIGQGKVIKLAFWPDQQFLFSFMAEILNEELIVAALPDQGVYITPRTDGSHFIINTTNNQVDISLEGSFRDRINSKVFNGSTSLNPYQVVWLDTQ